jgi:hypothetical protein
MGITSISILITHAWVTYYYMLQSANYVYSFIKYESIALFLDFLEFFCTLVGMVFESKKKKCIFGKKKSQIASTKYVDTYI